MAVTVAMYEKGREVIGERLAGLNLPVTVRTFDRNGTFLVDGVRMPPQNVDIDYLWLNSSISAEGIQEPIFDAMQTLRSVKVMQTFNAGLDHPFYKRMGARGVRICNSSAQGVAIAEYVFAQVLSVLQPVVEQRQLQARKEWKITPFREISGTNWLIFGFGPIGREITRRVKVFGGKVAVIRRSPDTGQLADAAGTMADMPRFLPAADIVVLACPLNAETRGFASSEFFAAMKPGSILINVARGGLVDDAALLQALDRDRIGHAILDVFGEEPLPPTSPYWWHPKVRMTGHTSFAGSGVRERWNLLFLQNIGRFVKGAPLLNEVDPRSLAA